MKNLLDFIDASPSPFHAVDGIKQRLQSAGFSELHEGDVWKLEPHKSYFLIRGGKTIVAWKCGAGKVAEQGFRILTAHSDSPTIKVKPNPHISSGNSSLLSVEPYGSPLLYTWLDRDLKLSGVVYASGKKNSIETHLVDLVDFPVKAPSLAIHLNRGVKGEGLTINPQTDLNLLFAQTQEKVELTLQDVLSKACKIPVKKIVGFDLRASDTQPGALLGADDVFLSAPRLDNLFSCYTVLQSLLAQKTRKLDQTVVAIWFDAEEIGSQTYAGARSNLLESVLTRIAMRQPAATHEDFFRATARSIMLSVDMAHAEHPTFKDRTDQNHTPVINGGLAIKHTATANLGDSGELAAWFKAACAAQDIPLQLFTYRCDHGGGSTVGPHVSSLTGIKTIDTGSPMLSMHSIRELAGSKDVDFSIAALSLFLTQPL